MSGLRDCVQRGQRLIQQQGARPRHQRARQRNPLPLSSGNFRRTPIEKSGNAKRLRDFAGAAIAFGAGQAKTIRIQCFAVPSCEGTTPASEIDSRHGGGARGRSIPVLRVEENRVTHCNAAGIGFLQPGNAIQNGGLPGARRAKQNGETRRQS